MVSPPAAPPDLSRLIDEATREETKRATRADAARASGTRSGGWPVHWTTTATALAVIAAAWVWANAIAGRWISDARVARDLQVLLAQAQTQVEDHLRRTGQLPPVLPDATLASVVRYTIDDPTATPPRYTLSVQMRGVQARGPAHPAEAGR